MMNTILIIDDEPIIRKLLARMMELEGYEVFQAADRASGLKLLTAKTPQLVLCDVFLPDGNGVEMVKEIKELQPETEVILLTAHGNIPDGVQAIKNGAFDYITKGDDNNKIIPIISRAMEKINSRPVQPSGSTVVPVRESAFDTVLGHSRGLQQVIQLARKVAVTDVPVLLTGETGTGKEVFAQAIHNGSARAKQPFVAINCSAFSKELLESEIFGHKAGAFTGALKDKKGLFEEANHGTIFLDEIGEMAYGLQAKLLRVLETGEYSEQQVPGRFVFPLVRFPPPSAALARAQGGYTGTGRSFPEVFCRQNGKTGQGICGGLPSLDAVVCLAGKRA